VATESASNEALKRGLIVRVWLALERFDASQSKYEFAEIVSEETGLVSATEELPSMEQLNCGNVCLLVISTVP
jgi:hypothetical protein